VSPTVALALGAVSAVASISWLVILRRTAAAGTPIARGVQQLVFGVLIVLLVVAQLGYFIADF